MICRLSLVRQPGQAPLKSTGQAGAGDGTGQLPGLPQAGQCQRAVSQQGHTVVQMEFIGVGWGLLTGWGGPSRGHLQVEPHIPRIEKRLDRSAVGGDSVLSL